MDKHGLLSTTLQHINDDIPAIDGAGSVPCVASSTHSFSIEEEADLVASRNSAMTNAA